MNEYEANEFVKKQLCREIIQIAEQIKQNGAMTPQELERLDKLYHAKKSLLTASAMEEAEEGYSGARGRNASNGRYMSRDGGSSYADGYSQGYSEAMNQMNDSGHYPMMPGYDNRRW